MSDQAVNGPPSTIDDFGYEYEPLAVSTSIRLLKVLPHEDNGRLQIKLWEQSAADPVPYRCLSYTWGDPLSTQPINANGRSMRVGNNLYGFLLVAAQRFPHETLWIDAISINQKDNTEKGLQVQRMGNVYRGAIEVLVWFGDSEGISRLFDWTCQRSTIGHEICYYLPSKRIPKNLRTARQDFARHNYWTRAWIVQELASARSIRFLCGLSESNPTSIKRCEDGSLVNMVPLRSIFSPIAIPFALVAHYVNLAFIGDSTMKPVLDFLKPMGCTDPHDQSSAAMAPEYNIWTFNFVERCCQNPRDRIYSLLSIINATSFEANYAESIVMTFWRAAEYFAVWSAPWRLFSLWQALELSGVGYSRAANMVEEAPFRCPLMVRRSKFRFGRSTCRRPDGAEKTSFKSPVVTGDILLCAWGNNTGHFRAPHFVLRPDEAGFQDSFTIAMYLAGSSVSRAVCLKDAELWHMVGGTEIRILRWNELERARDGFHDENSEWSKNFILRLPPFYILAAIGLWTSRNKLTSSVLEELDTTFGDTYLEFL
ncbi:heterokaryon incompatibility protein-domain-containing protein [Phaeosphaeria sp. MPI-PUGE-AT-0046c]|nr:heterokaryon incompatibility protein-domain-containing protein [Phaeosphaeria sp. MPI-PUGE-AT-0046c]